MSQKLKFPANIATAVKRAIRHLGEIEGSSFEDIKKYFLSKYQDSGAMLDSTSIKQFLKDAVDSGTLLKLDNGKYKVKETARRKKPRSRSRSRGTSRRRSRSRKRSGGRRRSRSGSRKRRRSSSGRRRKPATVPGKKKKKNRRKRKASDDEQEEYEDSEQEDDEEWEYDSDDSIAYGGEVCRNPSRGNLGNHDQLDPLARMLDLELPAIPPHSSKL